MCDFNHHKPFEKELLAFYQLLLVVHLTSFRLAVFLVINKRTNSG